MRGSGVLVSTALLSVALPLVSCAGKPKSFPAPSNILLITVDTLRADHLSCYGYPRQTSPRIDRLAAEGVRFAEPAVQWPKTGPSFASIFTATYPKDNNIVRRVGKPLPLEFRMLAEVLKDHGYQNLAVVANGAVSSELGYSQGFDAYVETWKFADAGEDGKNNPASRITELALSMAENVEGVKPYFLWVHYIDPHFPYEPPEGWDQRFQGDEHFQKGEEIWINPKSRRQQLHGIGKGQVLDGHSDLGFYVARYDAEIAFVDSQIGVLLDGLREKGLLKNTLTVMSSDHGESLGEHRYYFGHGRFGFQPGLRVPLIFHFPGVLSPRVETDPVELLHLAPTLLEAAGVPLPEGRWMQGRSLMPRLLGAPGPAKAPYAFSEAGVASARLWQRVVRDRRFKLIYAPSTPDQRWFGKQGEDVVLYDLLSDPGETKNVAADFPEEVRRLRQAIDRWWDAPAFQVEVDAPSSEPQLPMDEKTRKQLRALGYLE